MTAVIIGALIGMMTGGPFGAILGAFVGSWINRRYLGGQAASFGAAAFNQQRAQSAFFRTTFLVMGRVAKADGRVSEYEIETARAIMHNMRLSSEQRKMAIELFNEGKKPSSNIAEALTDFRAVAGATLVKMFLEIQLAAAYADGGMSPAESAVFKQMCSLLGVSNFAFEQIHKRFIAQREYYQQSGWGSEATDSTSLKQAYDALGVAESASDAEVKKAYRKRMSEHHPDKLVAKGLPKEMMEVAKEKAQEIQGAYDRVREARKKDR